MLFSFLFFFFQAEDGIRDGHVTGVQTCALPIYLLLFARAHGMTEVSDFITDLIEEFGLTERQHALPTALSSGQRRRLLPAAGFARPRRLLVLDEPEQRLDSRMQDVLARRIQQEEGTVVFASHDPELVRACADRVVELGER